MSNKKNNQNNEVNNFSSYFTAVGISLIVGSIFFGLNVISKTYSIDCAIAMTYGLIILGAIFLGISNIKRNKIINFLKNGKSILFVIITFLIICIILLYIDNIFIICLLYPLFLFFGTFSIVFFIFYKLK